MLRIVLILFACAAVVVGLLGFRGQTSTNRPWHVFLDMKYQARYGAQGQSAYFSDGRSSRMPVVGTVPYDGNGTRFDAGDHQGPNVDFIPESDPIDFTGRSKPDEKQMVKVKKQTPKPKLDKDGNPLKDKDGKPETENVEEEVDQEVVVNFFVPHIPKRVIEKAVYADGKLGYTGWDALMRRGQQRYVINCSVCHGETGFGGQGDTAHGIVGRKGMIGIASYHNDRLREVPDGYLYDVIANGKNTMSSYGHQIAVEDRWAIVAYLRALQLSQNAPESLVDPILRPRLLGGAK